MALEDRPQWTPERLAQASRAPGTWRGYATNWRDFSAWCGERGLSALPASSETVGAYIADRGQVLAPATIDRHLSAILVYHRRAGHPLDRRAPAIGDVLSGLRRTVGVAPHGKAALVAEELAGVVAALPDTLSGIRDRALLLVTFAAALRRSETAALEVRDLAFTGDGIVVAVRRGKDDQEGRGMLKGVPFGARETTCPVRAVRRWLIAARLGEGPLFRPIDRFGRIGDRALSGAAVADITKRAVGRWLAAEGVGGAERRRIVDNIGAHSLRSGFCTSAAEAGGSPFQIVQVTGHKRIDTVRRYVRQADLLSPHHITRRIGL